MTREEKIHVVLNRVSEGVWQQHDHGFLRISQCTFCCVSTESEHEEFCPVRLAKELMNESNEFIELFNDFFNKPKKDKIMIRDYEEGARVYIDEECLEIINRGIFPSKWIETTKSVFKKVGIVTKRFKPGFEFNVEWHVPYKRDDGIIQNTTILQMKDNWVKPLDKKWKRI